MKFLRIIGRNIRDAFKSVFRNFSLSLASISCITITLLVVSIAIILSYNVNNFTELVEKDVTIVAFMDNTITEDQKTVLLEQINKLDNISTVEYESKTEITEEMISSSDIYAKILGNWTEEENPLRNTYLVKVTDIEKIGDTAAQITELDNVYLVKYGAGMIEQLVSMFDMIRKVALVVVGALIIVTAFLITNTIKIAIISRRKEIEIMRLVGASNLNIKIPFIFEGIFLGIIGSIIPIVVTTYGYVAFFEHFNGILFTPIIKLVEPFPFIYMLSIVLVGIGIVVGAFGSSNAVRKYLKI